MAFRSDVDLAFPGVVDDELLVPTAVGIRH